MTEQERYRFDLLMGLRLELREALAEIDRLNERHQSHLALIRRMSSESVSPEEAQELRGQIAALIAEVGTLRNRAE